MRGYTMRHVYHCLVSVVIVFTIITFTVFSTNLQYTPNMTTTPAKLLYVSDSGRLGNQLFKYSAGYCVARQTDHTPALVDTSDLYTLFPHLSAVRVSRESYTPTMFKVTEDSAARYRPQVFTEVAAADTLKLAGYFQSWRYFSRCAAELREELRIDQRTQQSVQEYMAQVTDVYTHNNNIKTSEMTYIGLHVRRGDLTQKRMIKQGFTTAPVEYIRRAMEYYQARYEHPVFLVASDSIAWCKDHIPTTNHTVFFSSGTYLFDFALLASCDHSIMTVGTFGWFTSWLAEGEVVYYDGFAKPGSKVARNFNASDYYPPDWIAM